jgi:hypothetical protein
MYEGIQAAAKAASPSASASALHLPALEKPVSREVV